MTSPSTTQASTTSTGAAATPGAARASGPTPGSPQRQKLVDVRAPRFAAWVTTGVLAVVLLTASPWLLALQAVVFALGAAGRPPYALLFKRVVTTPPTETEPTQPLRFAQTVGLVFAVIGTLALAVGATTIGLLAAGFALAAALLNAAFGICLGCELYLILKRATTPSTTPTTGATS